MCPYPEAKGGMQLNQHHESAEPRGRAQEARGHAKTAGGGHWEGAHR